MRKGTYKSKKSSVFTLTVRVPPSPSGIRVSIMPSVRSKHNLFQSSDVKTYTRIQYTRIQLTGSGEATPFLHHLPLFVRLALGRVDRSKRLLEISLGVAGNL
jgi:hypothetical protein